MQGTVLNTAPITRTAIYPEGGSVQITSKVRLRQLNNHRYIVELCDFSQPVIFHNGKFRIYITKREAEITYAKVLLEFSG